MESLLHLLFAMQTEDAPCIANEPFSPNAEFAGQLAVVAGKRFYHEHMSMNSV